MGLRSSQKSPQLSTTITTVRNAPLQSRERYRKEPIIIRTSAGSPDAEKTFKDHKISNRFAQS